MLNLFRLCDISYGLADRLAADVLYGLLQRFLAEINQEDAGPFTDEEPSRFDAYATRSTGNDCDFPV